MSTAKPRLAALDVLRGMAVAGMILVVSPGDWGQRYVQLNHADWNGATAADMVFPAFLFSVGAALGLSFPRSLGTSNQRRRFWTKLLRRTVALVALGLAVETSFVILQGALVPFPDGGGWLGHVRIPGILQRIGICYALAGTLLYATARCDADGMARKDSLANAEATGEFVWNLATRTLAEEMNATSATFGSEIDEFERAGIQALPSRLVRPDRVAQSPVTFECRVTQIIRLETKERRALNQWLVIGEAVAVHIDRAMLENGIYQTARAAPITRGGGPADYFEIRNDALFRMKRPD